LRRVGKNKKSPKGTVTLHLSQAVSTYVISSEKKQKIPKGDCDVSDTRNHPGTKNSCRKNKIPKGDCDTSSLERTGLSSCECRKNKKSPKGTATLERSFALEAFGAGSEKQKIPKGDCDVATISRIRLTPSSEGLMSEKEKIPKGDCDSNNSQPGQWLPPKERLKKEKIPKGDCDV